MRMCVHVHARHRTTERQIELGMIRVNCIKNSDNLDLDLGKSDGSKTRVRRAKRYLLMLEWGVDERSCA